jgi:hypothetical protein
MRACVPAYFDLGKPDDWKAIEDSGSLIRCVVPEFTFSTIDPTDTDLLQAARDQFKRCQDAGQLVLGYVSTQSGARDPGAVHTDIDRWYDRYPEQMSGIFLDEEPQRDDSAEPFYRELSAYIQRELSTAHHPFECGAVSERLGPGRREPRHPLGGTAASLFGPIRRHRSEQ